jgi:hypothetical protein
VIKQLFLALEKKPVKKSFPFFYRTNSYSTNYDNHCTAFVALGRSSCPLKIFKGQMLRKKGNMRKRGQFVRN